MLQTAALSSESTWPTWHDPASYSQWQTVKFERRTCLIL